MGGRRGGGLDEKALSRARCKKEEGKKNTREKGDCWCERIEEESRRKESVMLEEKRIRF